MSLIGQSPLLGTVQPFRDNFSGNGSATVFTLTQAPGNKDGIIVTIDGIEQTDYTVAGTTLTFGFAVPSGTNNVSVLYHTYAGPTPNNQFMDGSFNLANSTDPTKKVAFDVSGVSTGTTRTVTMPNASGTLAFPSLSNTWSAKQIYTATLKVQQSLEKVTITASAPAATQNFDCLSQAIQYFTSNGSTNWTLNIRGDGSNSLDSLMEAGESITVTVFATMGATPYYANAHQIDGSSVTPKWMGGSAPSSGDASCINVYTYTVIKTASATFTVIASKGKTS